MVGYVNASLSVFRISDFENRSEPESDGSEFSGTPLKYCRQVWNSHGSTKVGLALDYHGRSCSHSPFWLNAFKAVALNLDYALKSSGEF
jgi:hypothetical protein